MDLNTIMMVYIYIYNAVCQARSIHHAKFHDTRKIQYFIRSVRGVFDPLLRRTCTHYSRQSMTGTSEIDDALRLTVPSKHIASCGHDWKAST